MLEYELHERDGRDWSWIGYDVDATRASLSVASTRVTELLRSVDDPDRVVDGTDWTIAETAAHLALIARANRKYVEGDAESVVDLARIAESNRIRIDEIDERRLPVLADELDDAIAGLVAAADGREGTTPTVWHSATHLPLGAVLGVCLGELLIHGHDIARTTRRPWPIDADDALHVIRATYVLAPIVLDRELATTKPVTYRVRPRGLPATTWRFADGAVDVCTSATDPVDCHLVVEPVTWMLVSYGRVSAASAALGGKALSWGRKPWAAFRLPSYFVGP